jgi:hypothetical protein
MRCPGFLLSVPVAAALLLAAGCGADGPADEPATQHQVPAADTGPAGMPAAQPATPGTECGVVPAIGGAMSMVVVRAGAVDCAQATTVLTRYFAKLTPAQAASPEGSEPVPLGAWTCASGPATDPWTTCSTEDGRQVDGVRAS